MAQRQRIAQEPLHIENLEDLQLGATLSSRFVRICQDFVRIMGVEDCDMIDMIDMQRWNLIFCRQFLETTRRRLNKRDAATVPTHRSEAEPRVQILILGAPEDHWHCRCGGEEHSRHVFMDIQLYYYIVTYKQINVYNYII